MRYFDEMSDSERAQYELKKRLETYKANKRKAEAQATDYTMEIKKIDCEFAKLKAEIVARLTNAVKADEYKTVSDIVNYKLAWLVRDIAEIKNKAIAKSFTSPQQAQDLLNRINRSMAEMWGNLSKTA
jgi:hypothetical protein